MTVVDGIDYYALYHDVVTLTRWMSEHHFTADEIAYAVEKPHKHTDLLSRARAGLAPEGED